MTWRIAAAVAVLAALAGCSYFSPTRPERPALGPGGLVSPYAVVPPPPPAAEPDPYQAMPRAAALASDPGDVLTRSNIRVGARQVGRAYWYGGGMTGRPTASGEILDHQAFTAAHAFLPFGTMARMTNLANGRTVDVRITDRMNGRSPAIIDLTARAAVRLGTEMSGDNRTELVVLSLPPGSSSPGS